MNVCESYLTRTYLKISKASFCRCTGIAKVPLPYMRALLGFWGKVWLFSKATWGWAFMSTIEAPSLKGHKEGGDGEGVLIILIQLPTLHM